MSYLEVRSYFSGIDKKCFDHSHAKDVIKHIFKGHHGVERTIKVIKKATSAINHGDAPKKVFDLADSAIKQMKQDKKKWFFTKKSKKSEVKDFDKIQKKYNEALKKAAHKSTK
jgi:hypothetical protein